MPLDSLLIEILADPVDKEPLLYFADEDILYNPRRRTVFRINDGIPVLLPDEGSVVDDAEHERLMATAESAQQTGGSGS